MIRAIVKYIPILTLFVSLYLLIISEDTLNTNQLILTITLAVTLLFVQIIKIKFIDRQKNWLQIDLIFLFMFFIVHFWLWLSLSEGYYSKNNWVSLIPLVKVNYAVSLSLLGMSSFIIGFNLYRKKVERIEIKNIIASKWWTIAGYIIFYLGVIAILIYIFVLGGAQFEGVYMGSTAKDSMTNTTYLLQSIFLKLGIVILLVTGGEEGKLIPKHRSVMIVFFSILLVYLMLGDRSEFLNTVSVAAFAYTRYYKKVTFSSLIVTILSGFFLMSVIGAVRNVEDRSIGTIIEYILSPTDNISIEKGASSLSDSAGAVLVAVQEIPSSYDYFLGDLKIVELLGVIPYGRTFFYDSNSTDSYPTSSFFIASQVFGTIDDNRLGTTLVADIYVDFGPLGVFLVLFLIGYITRGIEIRARYQSSIVSAVVFCYYAGLLVMLPRYSFLQIIRGLLWPFLIMAIINIFLKKSNTRAK